MKKLKLFSLIVCALFATQMWADDIYYYGCMNLTNGALTPGTTTTTQFVKGGATLTASTDISFSETPSTGGIYYNSSSLTSANLGNSSNWGTSQSSSRCIRGLKFASGTNYTLALGSKVATSITFYGWCGSKSKTLTIGGVEYGTPGTKNQFFSNEFTKEGNFTGNVTMTQDGDCYGILVITIVTGYSVTYEENGHGAAQTDLTGQTALPDPLPTLSESGWIFGGWFTDNGTFETAAVAGATLSANVTLYAKWTEDAGVTKYSVTYDLNGASGATPTQADVAAGVEITLAAAPSRDGYRFDGWLCSADSKVKAAGSSYTMTAANTTFTAQWTAVYTVTYALNGASGDAPTQDAVAAGTAITLAAAPTWAHHTFNGWLCNIDSEVKAAGASYTMTAASTTFTAQWTEDAKAAVTFRVDGETYGSVQNVYVGDKVAAVDAPTKAGNVFKGWYNGESKFNFNTAIASAEAITLDASWEAADANHYTYAYNDDTRYDGTSYHTPEGKVAASGDNKSLSTTFTLFSGAAGITSVVAKNAKYDGKGSYMNAYMKIATGGTPKVEFTIATGYTAVLKLKMGGYSNNPTVTIKDAEEKTATASGSIGGKATTENNYNEITYNLTAGTWTLTAADNNLYISHIDLQATAIPTALDENETEMKAVKVIRNGQLFIERDGKTYNVLGNCVK